MADISVCRICLSKDIKLFNLFKYKLAEPFEILTGIQISECDGLPHHICSFCGVLLLKSVSFKDKCCSSHEFLKFSALEHGMLSLDYLDSFNNGLSLQYTTKTNTLSIDCPPEDEIKREEMIDVIEEIKVEPIQQERRKRIKKDKKNKVESEEMLINLDDITIKTENIDIPDYDDSLELATEDRSTQDYDEVVEDTKYVKIVVLSKQQQKEEVEARKNSINYLNSFYKCDKCYKGFITDSTFRKHMARYDPKNGDFVCDICYTRRPNARSLRAHVLSSHERRYICKLCAHVSRSSHSAKEHRKWHKGFKFVCKTCGATFAKSTSYLTHVRFKHPSDNTCDICGETFNGEYGLKMHKSRTHKDDESQDQDSKVVTHCERCPAQFSNLAALKRHMDEGSVGTCDTQLKWCPNCGVGSATEEAFKEHLQVHQKKIVPCQDCPRTFATARLHATHYHRVHLGLKLRPHKHATVVCEICGKKCVSNAVLKYHQRIHTGEKPFQCPQCPKTFSVLQRLQIHLRTHTGESPYKCSQCPKAFKHKAALNRHDRVHTGAKPYSCQHCGKSFSQSNSMKIHVKTIHLKMPDPYRNKKKKNM